MAWQTADQIHTGDIVAELGFGAIVVDELKPSDAAIRMTGRWYESAAKARSQSGSVAPYAVDLPVTARVFRWDSAD